MQETKIVCMIGPVSEFQEILTKLAATDMSVARLNASHSSREERAEVIDRVRAVEMDRERPIAIMRDIPGPEIRTAPIEHTIELESGSVI